MNNPEAKTSEAKPGDDRSLRVFDSLKGDFKGSLSALMVSLPLSMTIGVIAFQPLGKEYIIQGIMAGVFGAAILSFVAGLTGAKSPLISGPRAASALIVASLMTSLFVSDALFFPSGESVHHVVAITFFAIFLAGAIQLITGASRFANIVKYIPYPVVSAFISSSALLIISGQAWVLLDIRKEKTFPDEDTLIDLVMRIGEAQPISMIAPAATIVAMVLVIKYARALPASLIGLLVGTGVYYLTSNILGGADIGATLGNLAINSSDISDGSKLAEISYLPIIQFPQMFTSLMAGGDLVATLLLVIPAALAMAALASLDTAVSLAAVDEKMETRSNLNREISGQGIGNMLAALLGGLIGSGGMVRTKPGMEAGGKSNMMALFSSVFMVCAIILLSDLIGYIPRSVISGVIVVLGFQLFDRWSLTVLRSCMSRYIFQRSGALIDGIIIILVVLVALSVDLIAAVGTGIVLSVIVFVSRMSRSLIRGEYRGPGIHSRSMWGSARQSILDKHGHQIAVLELDGAIFFGTADGLENRIDKMLEKGIRYVVLDMKRVRDIDSTGTFTLERIKQRLQKHGGDLVFSYVLKERRQTRFDTVVERRERNNKRSIWTFLEHSGSLDKLGEKKFFIDTDQALAFCEDCLIAQVNAEQTNSLGRRKINFPPILANLNGDELQLLRRMVTRQIFSAGEYIFKQGSEGDALYFVSRGRGEVMVHLHASGEHKRLGVLKSGSVFGEMALLDRKPRAASVIATENMVCYRLEMDDFENLKQEYHGIAIKLFNGLCIMLSERIRATNAMIAELEN